MVSFYGLEGCNSLSRSQRPRAELDHECTGQEGMRENRVGINGNEAGNKLKGGCEKVSKLRYINWSWLFCVLYSSDE